MQKNVDLLNYHYARQDAKDPAHTGSATTCKECNRIHLRGTVLRRDHVVERELVALKDELEALLERWRISAGNDELPSDVSQTLALCMQEVRTRMERAFAVSHA